MKKLKKYISTSSDLLMIAFGGLLEAIGINTFLIPSGFFEGGATGISMLGASLTTVPLYLFLILINAPFLALGWKRFGYKYIIKCVLTIVYLALLVKFIHIAPFSNDKILCAVFGGILVGAGTGFAINGSSALDGIEIASVILSKKFGITVGSIILSFNVIVFSFIALFHGYEASLYSVLTYIFSSRSTNFLVHGLENFVGLSVISSKSDQIKNELIDKLGVAVTIYEGKTGLENKKQEILFCAITRYDVQRVKSIINLIDEKAFMVTNPVENIHGGLVKTKLRKRKI